METRQPDVINESERHWRNPSGLVRRALSELVLNRQMYLLMLPTIVYVVIFQYIPIYGLQIAFRDFDIIDGIWKSEWVGLLNIRRFLNSYNFWNVLRNTLAISFMDVFLGFPVPVVMALLLNQMRSPGYKRFIQTVTYAPHFISVVVLAGMLNVFLAPRYGLVNVALAGLGFERIFFLAEPQLFAPIYVISGIWQHAGWGMIIYLAALSSVSTELYDAAIVDGATRRQRIRYIDFPAIIPTVVILLILRVGRIMNVGFQKAFLLQNPLNLQRSEIIATYIYKVGLLQIDFSYSTAIGLFNTVINFLLLISVNRFAKSFSETSLW